ncbi:MAG: SufD family Fe-S cluster assembly protein, partial [Alphaproteobacteria bacterium]
MPKWHKKMETLSAYKKEFSSFELPGTKALKAARGSGLESFLEAGIPTKKTEDWRYVNLSILRAGHLKRASGVALTGQVPRVTGWPQIVVENGKIIEVPKTLKGVEIFDPSKTLEKYQEPGLFDSPLERLNMAFAKDGLGLKIKKSAQPSSLEIVFLNTSAENEALYLRNLILVEGGAKGRLLIRTLGETTPGWTSQVTNIYLGANSELALTRDFEGPENALVTVRDFAAVEKGATFKVASLLAGLSSARYEIEAALLGKNAHAELSGGMLAGENDTIDVLTRVHHVKGKTTSNQTFKGVAGAKGSTAFQGRVLVEKDAQKIEAHQNCHNLILERTGEVNVKPELIIFADDVICSHG